MELWEYTITQIRCDGYAYTIGKNRVTEIDQDGDFYLVSYRSSWSAGSLESGRDARHRSKLYSDLTYSGKYVTMVRYKAPQEEE